MNNTTGLTTANENADDTAVKVYHWLAGLPARANKKLISGAFGGYTHITGEDAFSMRQAEAIHTATGQYPAIYGADYARGWDITEPGEEANLIDYGCNAELITHWEKGGLVAISHHLPNPIYAGNNPGTGQGALKQPISNEQYSRILALGSDERQRWLAMLDKIAEGLMELNRRGITVFYRPLHEMNGEWFWWGASGYENSDTVRMELYKMLYQDMFNYFTYQKGLNNLLWVYSPDALRGYKSDYYPGHPYVDITGLDMYLDNPQTLCGYQEMLDLNKPFAFPEIGPRTIDGQLDYGNVIDVMLSAFPQATFFMPWNSVWSPLENVHPENAYNHPHVMNRGDVWNGNVLSQT
ncbi:glycosyl hydrolase [Lonsdalea quercina]|uniref:glycosyl hydrolase n=1 Tax=Lonsdalea quercina TaxID=71657 RepID=UPI0039749507